MQNFFGRLFLTEVVLETGAIAGPTFVCSSTAEDRQQAVMHIGASAQRPWGREVRGNNLLSKFHYWRDRIAELCLQLQRRRGPAASPATTPLALWAPPCLGMPPYWPQTTHKPVSLYFFWADNKQVSCDSLTCLNSLLGEWCECQDSLWVLLGI